MHINSLSLYILTMVTAWSMSISGPGPGTSITLLGALLDCPPTFIFCWKYNDHTIWGLPSSEVESKYKKIPYIFFMVTFHRKVKTTNWWTHLYKKYSMIWTCIKSNNWNNTGRYSNCSKYGIHVHVSWIQLYLQYKHYDR